jgi:hypothetical protein
VVLLVVVGWMVFGRRGNEGGPPPTPIPGVPVPANPPPMVPRQ